MEPTVQNRKSFEALAKDTITTGRISAEGLRAVDSNLNDLRMVRWLSNRADQQGETAPHNVPHFDEVRQLIISQTFEVAWGLATVRFGRETAEGAIRAILADAEMLLSIRDEVFEAERLSKEWIMAERGANRGVLPVVINRQSGQLERVGMEAVAKPGDPAIVTTLHDDKEVMVTLARFGKWEGWKCEALLLAAVPEVDTDTIREWLAKDPQDAWNRLARRALVKTDAPVPIADRGVGFVQLATSKTFPDEELLLVVGLTAPDASGHPPAPRR